MATGLYQTTTLNQATIAVANRLADPGFVHWTQAELVVYFTQALRTWNALTASFHDEGVLNTSVGTVFYDLSVAIPSLCGRTVTDADLVSLIEYHLLEPQGTGVWAGSAQFTLTDITAAIERRRDQFLRETGMVLTRQTLSIAPPPDGRILLPESIVGIRRAAWQTIPGGITPLVRDDEWAFNHFSRAWVQSPALPKMYSVGVTPPLVLQVAPIPLDTGVLDLCSVNRGPTLVLGPTVLGVPDDWAWVVAFGALADLLGRDGLAFDPARSAYCEARWQQGLTLAALAPSVMAARVSNVVCSVRSLNDADFYSRSWQGAAQGQPTTILLASQNLVAVSPPPDNPVGGQYGVTLDLVRKAPIPQTLGSYLQIGPESLDTFYDYVEHLCLFKEGPGQLEASQPLLDRFYRAAGVTTDLDRAQVPNRPDLQERVLADQRSVPRVLPNEPASVLGVGTR